MLDRSFRIDSVGRSDVGRVRSLNEDSLLLRPDIGVWAVADGMGGHDAGDFASQTLVGELDRLEPARSAPELLTAMEDRVIAANDTLRVTARERGEHAIIGCTLASLVIFNGAYACVWSGDSRVYRVRNGAIEQISRDHTEAQELVDRGNITAQEAKTWPRKNVITRAIGVFDSPELEMVQGRIEDGDIFVLCSDGLTEHVGDHEILSATALRPVPGDGPENRLLQAPADGCADDRAQLAAVEQQHAGFVHAARVLRQVKLA